MPSMPESPLATLHLLLAARPCPPTHMRALGSPRSLSPVERQKIYPTLYCVTLESTQVQNLLGQLSENPSLLPNTTVLYYGRILATGVSAIESSYVDYVENSATAGFATGADVDGYARIPINRERIAFNVDDPPVSGSHVRIPGLFTMLGGPAFGPDALVSIINFYEWSNVVLYFQNAPEVVVLSEAFVSLALFNGIEFDLQKRESAGTGAAEADLHDLQAAKSNIFVFFGGLLQSFDRERQRCVAQRHLHPTAIVSSRTRQVMVASTTARRGSFGVAPRLRLFAAVRSLIPACCAPPHGSATCAPSSDPRPTFSSIWLSCVVESRWAADDGADVD